VSIAHQRMQLADHGEQCPPYNFKLKSIMSAPALNLKPSILDRLVDVSLHGAASPAWYTSEEIMEAVRRDLESLLNTRKTCQGLCHGLPEVTNSLITYGVTDSASLHVSTAAQRKNVARELEETIRRFEPRLSWLKVTIGEPATRKDRVLRMHLAGTLDIEPSLDFELSGSLELVTGRVSMTFS
jgi:type VI secretion system protein ImpF